MSMDRKVMYLLARTPVHVGAGNSVGAVDAPVMRERHTGIPIIPGSSLKGVLSDLWNTKEHQRSPEGEWLFGRGSDESAQAGSLLIGEARVLAFPVRSAAGCFAWITCPFVLQRFARDLGKALPGMSELSDADACLAAKELQVSDKRIVLEDYALNAAGDVAKLAEKLVACMSTSTVWQSLPQHLAVVSNSLFAHFVLNACEVVSRVRINDETGTVDGGGLFNQEQAPSETMFYSVLVEQQIGAGKDNPIGALREKLKAIGGVLQIGGDATTGLGFCDVEVQA